LLVHLVWRRAERAGLGSAAPSTLGVRVPFEFGGKAISTTSACTRAQRERLGDVII